MLGLENGQIRRAANRSEMQTSFFRLLEAKDDTEDPSKLIVFYIESYMNFQKIVWIIFSIFTIFLVKMLLLKLHYELVPLVFIFL